MKIVTYNVNGLRSRISQHGSLLRLLNSLNADIICFQETKLSRQELTADLSIAEGYESFFSCTRTSGKGRIGYSGKEGVMWAIEAQSINTIIWALNLKGVATFCRVSSAFSSNETALPVAAKEGFTGLLEHSQIGNTTNRDFLLEMLTEVEGLEEITEEELLKVDSEGRCIITDHGHFVLFNLYGPRAQSDNAERIRFKLTFFKILQRRWESLLSEGKRVFVVGDLNIAPAAIDCCDAGTDFEENMFRKWLRSLLVEYGGPFFDVFRAKHPTLKEAYTCWSQSTGAEEFNYGSRIDHILIAGPCLHQNHDIQVFNFVDCHVNECDILTQFKRWKSDSIPRWKRGRSIKLEGSDHAPVFVSLIEIPNLPEHNTPSLAARYFPVVRGLQQTIVSLLMKRQVAAQVKNDGAFDLSSEENITAESCNESEKRSFQDRNVSAMPSVDNVLVSNSEAQGVSRSVSEQGVANEATENMVMVRNEIAKSIPPQCLKAKKKARHSGYSQRTLKSFFQEKSGLAIDVVRGSHCISHNQEGISKGKADSHHLIREMTCSNEGPIDDDESICFQKNESHMSPTSHGQGNIIACSSKKEKNNVALSEWQRIQQLMQNSIPLCDGHSEPCVPRVVKKAGPNLGRRFYVCARAEGPQSNPEARCDYFKWANSKSGKRGS